MAVFEHGGKALHWLFIEKGHGLAVDRRATQLRPRSGAWRKGRGVQNGAPHQLITGIRPPILSLMICVLTRQGACAHQRQTCYERRCERRSENTLESRANEMHLMISSCCQHYNVVTTLVVTYPRSNDFGRYVS